MRPERDPLYLCYEPTSMVWEVLSTYVLELPKFKCSLVIPQGFLFNASVPVRLESVFPSRGLGLMGPMVHDFIYAYDGEMPPHVVQPNRSFTRAEADEIFLDLMAEEGISRFRRLLAYWAVRVFGTAKWTEADRLKRGG